MRFESETEFELYKGKCLDASASRNQDMVLLELRRLREKLLLSQITPIWNKDQNSSDKDG